MRFSKNTFLPCFLLLFICNCTPPSSPIKTINDSTVVEKKGTTISACDSLLPIDLIATSSLKRWISFYEKINPNFRLSHFKFQNCSKENVLLTQEEEPTNEYLSLYRTLFVYAPDSSSFIDMDSYNFLLERDKKGNLIGEGGDPDTEVALVNSTTHTRKRVLFFGPTTYVEDAVWLNKNEVIIAFLSNNDTTNTFKPYLVKINTVTNEFTYFVCSEKIDQKHVPDYVGTVRRKSIQTKK
jgi:hypothetical protein